MIWFSIAVTSSNHVRSNKVAWFSPLVPHLTIPPPAPQPLPILLLLTVTWPCCGPVLSETAESSGFISTSCLPSSQLECPVTWPAGLPPDSNKKHLRKWSGVQCGVCVCVGGGAGLGLLMTWKGNAQKRPKLRIHAAVAGTRQHVSSGEVALYSTWWKSNESSFVAQTDFYHFAFACLRFQH